MHIQNTLSAMYIPKIPFGDLLPFLNDGLNVALYLAPGCLFACGISATLLGIFLMLSGGANTMLRSSLVAISTICALLGLWFMLVGPEALGSRNLAGEATNAKQMIADYTLLLRLAPLLAGATVVFCAIGYSKKANGLSVISSVVILAGSALNVLLGLLLATMSAQLIQTYNIYHYEILEPFKEIIPIDEILDGDIEVEDKPTPQQIQRPTAPTPSPTTNPEQRPPPNGSSGGMLFSDI